MGLKAFVLVMMILSISAGSYASTVFTLHRLSPPNSPLDLDEVRAQDESRHLAVPKFPLEGSSDPRSIGVYYTTVKLGTPAKELNVLIDSGSSIFWVNCKPCNNCPESNSAGTSSLTFFDVTTSSTASFDSCSYNPKCPVTMNNEELESGSVMMKEQIESGCSTENSRCKYSLGYVVGTIAEGYYISDLFTYSTIYPGVATSSASISFGCGFNQSGAPMPKGVVGILGLGQEKISVVSQLSKKGIAPNVFSHCLRGDGNGGGTLVLGEATSPNMVYTPLLKTGSAYRVHLESISVDGKSLTMNNVESNHKEIFIDSGATLTYLWPELYDPFVKAITSIAAKSGVSASSQAPWSYCFTLTSSVNEIFPQVHLNFAGGASMVLPPQDYLVHPRDGTDNQWCIGFQKANSIAALGDLVLKDKIIVYDIARQRLGMATADCSLPLSISTTSGANNAAHLNMFSVIFIGIVTLFCLL